VFGGGLGVGRDGCSEDVQVVLGGGKNWVVGLNTVNTRVTLVPQSTSDLIPLDRSGDSRGGDDRRVEQ
jgi:hypothetical protein